MKGDTLIVWYNARQFKWTKQPVRLVVVVINHLKLQRESKNDKH